MNDIFKIRDLSACKKVHEDEKTAFTYYELHSGYEIRNYDLPLNYIIFVLEGQLDVNCNLYDNCSVTSDEMIVLMRTASAHVKAVKKTSLYLFYFDNVVSLCEYHLLNAYLPDASKIIYTFKPVAIPEQIVYFLKQVQYFQDQKVDCVNFNSLKHREFFILLRHFCPREDFVMFLAPLIGRSVLFRNKVLEKYAQLGSGNVSDFADLVGMGRKNFEKLFHKEFGLPPAKWMLQEKAKHLFVYLSEPEITLADAMDRFHFNSAAHFNRFCLQHFKKTPGAIIKKARQKQDKDSLRNS